MVILGMVVRPLNDAMRAEARLILIKLERCPFIIALRLIKAALHGARQISGLLAAA